MGENVEGKEHGERKESLKRDTINDIEGQLATDPHPEVLYRILTNILGQVGVKKILTAEIRKVIDGWK